MKSDTHPTYYTGAMITCTCGSKMAIGGTKEKIDVEICSSCHPFFTGDKKIIDTAGRVEKFKTRSAKTTTRAPKVDKRKKA